MLSYIKVDLTLTRRRKFIDTRALLGVKKRDLVGLLEALWIWGAEESTDGVVKITPGIIQDVFEWDPQDWPRVLSVLTAPETCWLEDRGDGTHKIHHWEEHQGALLEVNEKKRLREKARRQKIQAEIQLLATQTQGVSDTCGTRGEHVSAANEHVQHEKRPEEKREEDIPPKPPKGEVVYPAWFEDIWSIYRNKKEKQAAYSCCCARVKDGYTAEQMKQSVENYNVDLDGSPFVKMGKTWFGSNKPFAEYIEGIPGVVGTKSGGNGQKSEVEDRFAGWRPDEIEAILETEAMYEAKFGVKP